MKRWFLIGTDNSVKEITNVAEPDNLNWLQTQVGGGLVEHVQLDGRTELWCNEEGKFNGMVPNKVATIFWELFFGPSDVIFGPIMLTFTGNPTLKGRAVLDNLERIAVEVLAPV